MDQFMEVGWLSKESLAAILGVAKVMIPYRQNRTRKKVKNLQICIFTAIQINLYVI
tara:strand:+ start:2313 stop:2480 length:168 start_codon:yes stop_codon:yes gene_type:complete